MRVLKTRAFTRSMKESGVTDKGDARQLGVALQTGELSEVINGSDET